MKPDPHPEPIERIARNPEIEGLRIDAAKAAQ
jgi:hypothetical protein